MYSRCQAHSVALLFPLLEEFTDEVDGNLALRVIPLSRAEHFHAVLAASWVMRLSFLPVTVVLHWAVVCIHKLSFFFHVVQANEGSEEAAAGDVVSNQGVGCLIFRHGQCSSSVPAVDQGFSIILLFFHNVIEFLVCLPDTCYNFKRGEKKSSMAHQQILKVLLFQYDNEMIFTFELIRGREEKYSHHCICDE